MKYDWYTQIIAKAPQDCAKAFADLKASNPYNTVFEEVPASFNEYIVRINTKGSRPTIIRYFKKIIQKTP